MGSYVHQRDKLLGKTNFYKKNYIQKVHEKNSSHKQVSGLNFERQKTMDDFRHVESSFKRKYQKYINNSPEGRRNSHKPDVHSDEEEYAQSALPPLRVTRRRKSVQNVGTETDESSKSSSRNEHVNWNDIVRHKRSKSDLSKELSYLQSTLHSLPTSAGNSSSEDSPRQISPERPPVSLKFPANARKATQASPRLDTPAVVRRDSEKKTESGLVNPLAVLPDIPQKSESLDGKDSNASSGQKRQVQFLDEDEVFPIYQRPRRNTLETGMLSKYRRNKMTKNTQIPSIAEEPLDIPMPRLQRSKSFGDLDKLRENIGANNRLDKTTLRVIVDQSQGAKKFKYFGKLVKLGLKDFNADEPESPEEPEDNFSDLRDCRYLRIPEEVVKILESEKSGVKRKASKLVVKKTDKNRNYSSP